MGKVLSRRIFFHKHWFIIGDCKYNFIPEIKIEKNSYAILLLCGKQILKNVSKMLINANEHDDIMVGAIFFTTKRSAA